MIWRTIRRRFFWGLPDYSTAIITPPASRAWRSYKFASLNFSGVFSVSQVGLPLMGTISRSTPVSDSPLQIQIESGAVNLKLELTCLSSNGWYRCALLSEPRLLNSISSGICRQNTQFNMHTTISKQQEGCTCKDSHPKCFMTTNSTAKLSPGTVNAVMYMSWESHNMQRSIRIQFVNILILFDVTDYRLLYGNGSISFSPRSDKITWQSRDPWRLFAYVDQLMLAVLKAWSSHGYL